MCCVYLQLQFSCERQLTRLASMQDTGDSLSKCQSLIADFNDFEQLSKVSSVCSYHVIFFLCISVYFVFVCSTNEQIHCCTKTAALSIAILGRSIVVFDIASMPWCVYVSAITFRNCFFSTTRSRTLALNIGLGPAVWSAHSRTAGNLVKACHQDSKTKRNRDVARLSGFFTFRLNILDWEMSTLSISALVGTAHLIVFCMFLCQNDFTSAEQLRQRGESFISSNHYAIDCIRPKCSELQRICAEFSERLTQRRRTLDLSLRLYQHIDKVINTTFLGLQLVKNKQHSALMYSYIRE